MRRMRRRRKRKRASCRSLPAEQVASTQSHKVDLAGASGSHGGEEDLVVSFTEELESLGSLVHENTVQMSGLH